MSDGTAGEDFWIDLDQPQPQSRSEAPARPQPPANRDDEAGHGAPGGGHTRDEPGAPDEAGARTEQAVTPPGPAAGDGTWIDLDQPREPAQQAEAPPEPGHPRPATGDSTFIDLDQPPELTEQAEALPEPGRPGSATGDSTWIDLDEPREAPSRGGADDRVAASPARAETAELLLDFTGLGRHLRVARGGTVRLGRSTRWATPDAADLLADERTVSGRHAEVEFAEDGRVWLTEVPRGSSNGTRVNGGLALTPGHRHEIHNGDTVELGPRVEFLVRRPTPHRGATAP
ncbi:FHA domain-containing protein [Streptomyces abyssomicinicus]|uniref:FHA domain-containing protein n=1 Tax=Streptomyces abyssomicinicus TaxID=574929 RepID=UPI001FE87445|nr:FHA domain-containing protein [Streptomyces abyssomicinicus]